MDRVNIVENSLIHISHLHPLKLVASPEPKPICHACSLQCADQSFTCIDCWYFLHVTCAATRRTMDHPSHPAHTLRLELTPPYPNGTFLCDGCGDAGATFCLRCRECSFDLHLPCAAIPQTVNHPSDVHPLYLFYNNPNPNLPYHCGLCHGTVEAFKWFYHCNICNYGGHVGCFAPQTLEVLSSGLRTQAPPMLTPQHPQQNFDARAANEMNDMLKFQKDMMQLRLERNKQRIMAEIIHGAIAGSRI